MINEEVLIRIVRPCRKALRLSEVIASEFTDGSHSVLDDILGDLEDALFIMNQEKTDTLSESVVDQLIRNLSISDEEVAEMLTKLINSEDKLPSTPPRKKLTEALINKGFPADFIKEYRSEIYTAGNLRRFSAGDPALWETVQNLFDEYTYFNCDCTGDDDLIVMMTNESWLPDEEEQG